jgi:hypothetical protein
MSLEYQVSRGVPVVYIDYVYIFTLIIHTQTLAMRDDVLLGGFDFDLGLVQVSDVEGETKESFR